MRSDPAALEDVPTRAVLFDLDGTLIDTEGHYRSAVQECLASAGVQWDERLGHRMRGLASPLLADLLIELGMTGAGRDDLAAVLDRRVEQHIRNDGVPWKHGARELVGSVVASPLRSGLVTMSCRAIVDLVLVEIDWPGFDVVITHESVLAPKPAPDAYLLAAEQLGLEPATCTVVEDSVPGAVAARSAGMWVIGAHLQDRLLDGLVDEVWPSLSGRSRTGFATRGRTTS